MIDYFLNNVWLVWLLASVLFLIVELTLGDFTFMCFAIAALITSAVTALGAGWVVQILAWIVMSVAFLIWIRPFALNYLHSKEKQVKTNADALIGKEGTVAEAIEPGKSGYVAVDGDTWKAVTRGTMIEKGATVVIVDRKSIIVTVERKD